MKYDVDYFLNKFDTIPDDEWYTGNFVNSFNPKQKCALGHCGGGKFYRVQTGYATVESLALSRLLWLPLEIYAPGVNDGEYPDLGDTPKERIMTALILVKAGVRV